jgi:lipopolysaccharide/colanic/teichoic acid biosynthesis glycosyltransferase
MQAEGSMAGALLREEPKQAFHCRPPDDRLKERYRHIFALKEPLAERKLKAFFDRVLALVGLVVTSPIFLLLFLGYLVEGSLIRENRGPPFVNYRAMSAGREFRKYKFRTIKTGCVDQDAAKRGDWHAYAGEWTPESLTYVGRFVKKTYLDELPQLWNILRGDMSFVGPRPLATHHYQRDLAQGNVSRMLLKGGLVGQGQALKGTDDLGSPEAEYDYIEKYLNSSPVGLFWHDLKIMGRSLKVVLEAKGL